MLSFSIRLTEIALTSLGVKNVNSTLSTSDEIGCAIFMVESASQTSDNSRKMTIMIDDLKRTFPDRSKGW